MIFIIFLTCNQSLENQITKTTMLVELTIEVYEESFVIVHQHGGNDVNCNPRIHFTCMFLHSLSLIYSMWCKKSVRKSYFHSETKSITDSITLRLDKFNNNIPWLARTIYNYANCSVAMFTRDTFTWGKCIFIIENVTQCNRNVNLLHVNVSRVNTAYVFVIFVLCHNNSHWKST